MELQHFELARDKSYTFPHYGMAARCEEAVGRPTADIQPAINTTLHLEGTANPTSTTDTLLKRFDLVIRASRSVCPGISNLKARQT